mgnify:CR=1 FL=1
MQLIRSPGRESSQLRLLVALQLQIACTYAVQAMLMRASAHGPYTTFEAYVVF